MAPSTSESPDDFYAALVLADGRRVGTYVTEALHHHGFTLNARFQAEFFPSVRVGYRLRGCRSKTPRPVASPRPRTPFWFTGLPVTQPAALMSSG